VEINLEGQVANLIFASFSFGLNHNRGSTAVTLMCLINQLLHADNRDALASVMIRVDIAQSIRKNSRRYRMRSGVHLPREGMAGDGAGVELDISGNIPSA